MPPNVGFWLGAVASLTELIEILRMPVAGGATTTGVAGAAAGVPLSSLPPQLASARQAAIAMHDSCAVDFFVTMVRLLSVFLTTATKDVG